MIRLCRCLIFLVLLPASAVQAASLQTTKNFFQGRAEVESRAASVREEATRIALSDVLLRLSGDSSISMNSESGLILLRAVQFVRSYRYETKSRLVRGADGSLPGRMEKYEQLVVDFDGAALIRASKEAGLPMWDPRRPTTAVWLLAPSERSERSLWSGSEIQQRWPALQSAAEHRGVPLNLPLMDELDAQSISPLDIAAEDYARLQLASERYDARHVLLVRLLQRDEYFWEARWTLLRPDEEPLRWNSNGDDGNLALANGFDYYADYLAQIYVLTVAPGWVQTTHLRMVGLYDLQNYARVMSYLQGLNLVQSIRPLEVNGGDVVFLLEFEGDVPALERSIELGGVLEKAPEPPPIIVPATPAPLPTGMGEPQTPQEPPVQAEAMPGPGASPAPAELTPQQPETGLSFFAVTQSPELRYQLRP